MRFNLLSSSVTILNEFPNFEAKRLILGKYIVPMRSLRGETLLNIANLMSFEVKPELKYNKDTQLISGEDNENDNSFMANYISYTKHFIIWNSI